MVSSRARNMFNCMPAPKKQPYIKRLQQSPRRSYEAKWSGHRETKPRERRYTTIFHPQDKERQHSCQNCYIRAPSATWGTELSDYKRDTDGGLKRDKLLKSGECTGNQVEKQGVMRSGHRQSMGKISNTWSSGPMDGRAWGPLPPTSLEDVHE